MLKVLLCAYNEAQNLKKLLADINYELKILGHDYEIICCLDGTSDDSIAIIDDFKQSCAIRVLPLLNQRGLGLAYKRLFLDIAQNANDEDLLISLDADNTHNPEQISAMLQHFTNNNLDILVASRFCNGSKMDHFPFYRQLISKTVSILLQTFFPIKKINQKKLQDYSSGYRIYKAKKIKELFKLQKNNFITEPEFTYTCELLIKLSKINCRIDEIVIEYNYDRKIGASKLRLLRNFYRLMLLIFNLKFR